MSRLVNHLTTSLLFLTARRKPQLYLGIYFSKLKFPRFSQQQLSSYTFNSNDKGDEPKKKPAKLITFKDKIEQHDYTSKLNNIKKWLIKGHPVKATISNLSQDAKKTENLYESLAKDLVTLGKFEMKKNNGKETKFVIEPNALDKENSSQVHS